MTGSFRRLLRNLRKANDMVRAMQGETEHVNLTRSVAPCQRCGCQPEAMRDECGYTVFHLCGDRLRMAANYPTVEDAIENGRNCNREK